MPRPRFAPAPSSTTKRDPLSVIFTRHSHRELWPRGQPVQNSQWTRKWLKQCQPRAGPSVAACLVAPLEVS
jgi:hypothetical protein